MRIRFFTTQTGGNPIAPDEPKTVRKRQNILLSHHPTCGRFGHHVVNIGGYDLCMGCLFVYPTMAVTLLVLYLLQRSVPYSYLPVFVLGCILFFLAVARRVLWKGLRDKRIQVVFRMILGISFACVVEAVFIAPTRSLKIVLAIAILVAWVAYQLGGWLGIRAECKSCPSGAKFPQCDGVRGSGDKAAEPMNGSAHGRVDAHRNDNP